MALLRASSMNLDGAPAETETRPRFWADELAADVLAGARIDRDAARRILGTAADDLPQLLLAGLRIRERGFGRRVRLCMLQNARSGLCSEDCHYCSQSAASEAVVPRYPLLSAEELAAGADRALAEGSKRYCMVTSGRLAGASDVERFADAARRIKRKHPHLELCVSPGFLEEEQGRELKAAGIGWINHNLNTSERFHPEICSTHNYADRLRTLGNARRAGLRLCSGGIIGMGESKNDIVDLAFALRELGVSSLPVNFLHPIPGTPLAERHDLTPTYCLNALCLFRFTNPNADIRAAGGRELNLGWFQPLALYPATSIFVAGYLTTPGQAAGEARRMVEEMGFEVDA